MINGTERQELPGRNRVHNRRGKAVAIVSIETAKVQLGRMVIWSLAFVLAVMFAAILAKGHAHAADDRHAGYYYPVPLTTETYASEVPTLSGVSRKSRVGFIVGLTDAQMKRGFAPGYHIFAKGTNAEKLIIVATGDGRYQTIFQLRALMAAMTSMARTSPLFSQSGSAENLNFLDLCKLAGFTQVTISNGVDVAHQIMVK